MTTVKWNPSDIKRDAAYYSVGHRRLWSGRELIAENDRPGRVYTDKISVPSDLRLVWEPPEGLPPVQVAETAEIIKKEAGRMAREQVVAAQRGLDFLAARLMALTKIVDGHAKQLNDLRSGRPLVSYGQDDSP